MKKYLKFVIIFLLVVATITGTTILFFKLHKKNLRSSDDLVKFMQSQQTLNLDDSLDELVQILNEGVEDANKDTRFDNFSQITNLMDGSLGAVVGYLYPDETEVDSQKIINKYNQVKSRRATVVSMLAEYKTKSDSNFFPRGEGANDLFKALCQYSKDYASLLQAVESELKNVGVNQNTNIKFSLIDVYARLISSTYAEVKYNETSKLNYVEASNIENLKVVLNKISIKNGEVLINGKANFSVDNNKFISAYNNCNKDLFAKNLKSNLNSLTTIENCTNNEQIATFYFNKIINGGV